MKSNFNYNRIVSEYGETIATSYLSFLPNNPTESTCFHALTKALRRGQSISPSNPQACRSMNIKATYSAKHRQF